MRNLSARLARLESQSAGGFMRIVIKGGFPEPQGAVATTAGQHRWLQHDGETVEAFADRAERLARAAGEPFVVIGGLPVKD